MKKKVLALVLTAAMAGSMMGCGDSDSGNAGTSGGSQATGGAVEADADPSRWPTVTVQTLVGTRMPDEEMVEEKLNEYLVSINAGVKMDMVQIEMAGMSETLTLMLSDKNQPLDVWCWRFYSNLDGCVKNEQCIPLDGYKELYPDLWEMYPDKVMQTQQIGGVQYAIPSVDSYGTYETYMFREDLAKELGIADRDGEKITLEEMTQIMKDAKAAHPEYAYMINTNDEPVIGIDSLGNPNWLGVLMNRGVGQTEIVNLYETQEWKDYCYLMKEWNDAGLQMDDPLNNSMTIEQYNNGVAAGCYVGGYSADYIKALLAYSPYMSVQYRLTDLVGTSASVLGGWMVSSVCKNPDAAMKALYLLTTDEKVARFFILGIEGVHYTVDENGCAWYAEGVDPNNLTWNMTCPWFYPNQCLSHPLETTMSTYYTDMLDAPNHAEFSSAMGFIFDSTAVYDQMAACATVVAQYRDALLYGLVDVDTYLEKFNQELKDAGIDDVIAEEQRQFEEFLASQK
ncbi:MAG: ABC transporter substrate-binding protein [Butyrivibrio sp.]|nr:ABC transporter substrate-binding protein [Acetatifactor muris]MCM1559822.1 ABC transporter substrate-binding protein [Butyrivibrio sp.]